ncbi:MAG: hypothetical protein FJ267_13620, partial [Planctomycetes bacterium]|nr:hypothetical protein [Planctomycetota bacterium]
MSNSKSQPIADSDLGETVVPGQDASGHLEQTAVFPQKKPQGNRMDEKAKSAHSATPDEGAKSSDKGEKGKSTIGKYKLIKKLGQGGMGEVYLGEDSKLGRRAAIKVLSKQL